MTLRRETYAFDDQTHVCDDMLEAGKRSPAYSKGMRLIACADVDGKGAFSYNGYANDLEAARDMILHIKAVLEANGKKLVIIGEP